MKPKRDFCVEIKRGLCVAGVGKKRKLVLCVAEEAKMKACVRMKSKGGLCVADEDKKRLACGR
jgi:hypothetical protein